MQSGNSVANRVKINTKRGKRYGNVIRTGSSNCTRGEVKVKWVSFGHCFDEMFTNSEVAMIGSAWMLRRVSLLRSAKCLIGNSESGHGPSVSFKRMKSVRTVSDSNCSNRRTAWQVGVMLVLDKV